MISTSKATNIIIQISKQKQTKDNSKELSGYLVDFSSAQQHSLIERLLIVYNCV